MFAAETEEYRKTIHQLTTTANQLLASHVEKLKQEFPRAQLTFVDIQEEIQNLLDSGQFLDEIPYFLK